MKRTMVFPHKWAQKQRVWKGKTININKNSVGNGEDAAWNALINEMEELKKDISPAKDAAPLGMSNKFAVDVFACTINHFKRTMPETQRGLPVFLRIMDAVAGYTCQSSISAAQWGRFVNAHADWQPFFRDIGAGNTLYDNPAKMTKARLFSCAALLYKGIEPTCLFGVGDHSTKIPKMISIIYKLETDYHEISPDVGHTSNSEHLLHLLLSLGAEHTYAWNRNHIPHSVRNVTFEVNPGN